MKFSLDPDPDLRLRRAAPAGLREGSVLVEFALVSLVLYILLGATLGMGRLLFSAQVVQEAARVAARELALTPLRPDIDFETAMASDVVRERVFDPSFLVIDMDAFPDETEVEAFLATLPPVNQALRPGMIIDHGTLPASLKPDPEGGGSIGTIAGRERIRTLLRYPGALLRSSSLPPGHPSSGFAVGIPAIVRRSKEGVETIRWIPVMEEIRPDPQDPATGPFSLMSPGPQKGLAAVRINYPFQSGMLSGYRNGRRVLGQPNLDRPIRARDSEVSALNAPIGGVLRFASSGESGTYAGPFGLGRQFALGDELRPFRKLLSGQAIFRREVFE
ncbi:MAG: TadE family protein [Planctomycetota bacterium]